MAATSMDADNAAADYSNLAGRSKLAQTGIKACLAYNTWDINEIMSHRDPQSWTQVHPKSLDRPRLNNDEYKSWFNGTVKPLFQGFTVSILDVIEDSARHKVVLHCSSAAQTIIGPYSNEYVIIIKTTDDHERVLEFVEFVDSAYSNDYFARLRAALVAKAAAGGGGQSPAS